MVEGMRFVTHSLRSKQARTIDTLIVPGGFGVVHALRDKDLVSSAEKLETNARRVCAV
jgi:enhancing lycopene biosynthesis protein 2